MHKGLLLERNLFFPKCHVYFFWCCSCGGLSYRIAHVFDAEANSSAFSLSFLAAAALY